MKKAIIKVNGKECLAVVDDDGNAYRITDEVTEEQARQYLATNVDCTNCLDCKYCRDCDNCVKCDYCSTCENCTDCNWCEDCAECKLCLSSYYCYNSTNLIECKFCKDAQDLETEEKVNFKGV